MQSVSILLLLLAATPLPWNQGDVVWDGWKVTEIKQHAEFLRYSMSRKQQRTVVEITYKKSSKQSWSTRHFRVQPAPGYQPNYPLLRAMRRHLSTWEKKSEHQKLFVKRGVFRGEVFTPAGAAKLLLGLMLLFGLLLLPPAKRALGAVFVGWTGVAAHLNPRPDRFGPKWVGKRGLKDGIAVLVVFAATTGTLLLYAAPPPLYPDTCVDLGLARDCVDGVGCTSRGNGSSFMDLQHGALWSYFLAACRWLSWGPDKIHVAVTTLHGVAVALFAWVLMGLVRRWTALLATSLLWISAIHLIEYPVLWNPTIAPITSVLFFASLVALLKRGRLVYAPLAGIFLALVVDAHMVHFLYVPVYLLAVAMACRRPWLAALLGCAACAGVLWGVSGQAVIHNLQRLSATGYLLPALWALAVPFVLGLAWRDAYDTLDAPVLQFVFLAFVAVILMLVPVVIQRVVIGHPVIPRYFLPAIPLAALLLARLARELPEHWALRRVSFVAVWGYALWLIPGLVVQIGAAKTYWSISEVNALAGALHRRGYSYEMMARQLRGPQHQQVLKCLAVFTPKTPTRARTSKRSEALYVTRLQFAAPPKRRAPGLELVGLAGASVALLQRRVTWVDVGCNKPCTHAKERPISYYRRAQVSHPERPVSEISYRVVIRGNDPARTIRVVGHRSPWRIVSVSGVRWSGKLPARRVVLLHSAHKTGTITFRLRPNQPPTLKAPDFVER